jgi:Ser/Thr protein kinase RdoA (MazF antagonist)
LSPSHLAAAYSTLDSFELSRMVADHYALRYPEVVLLRRAFNDNYRVTADGERYILRVYLHNKYYVSGPDDLKFELDLLDFLAAEGLGVATAVPRVMFGDTLGGVPTAEGLRHYALFRFAPGVGVSRPNDAQTRAMGESLARIHLAADRFTSNYPRHSLDLTAIVDASLERVAPYLAERPEDLAFLRERGEAIRQHLGNLKLPPGGWGIIHGDPHAGNCHFVDDQPFWFDFDTCGYGWRAYDVAVFMGDDKYEHRPAFLAGYQSVRPLSPDEIVALPVFIQARVLWDAGDIVTLAHIWGELMAKAVVDGMVKRLRELSE